MIPCRGAVFSVVVVAVFLLFSASSANAQESEPTGTVEGFAYDATTGEGACINIEFVNIDTGFVSDDRAQNGAYSRVIPAGSYLVHFIDSCDFRYADQWWNGRSMEEDADIVTVGVGEVITGIDAAMREPEQDDLGGWISGTIRDPDGNPVRGICAIPFVDDGVEFHVEGKEVSSPSDETGRYRISHLGTRNVKVFFVDCSPFIWDAQWWNGATDFGSADWISVTEGEEVFGVDVIVHLPEDPGGWVSGIVRDIEGNPIRGICVEAFDEEGNPINPDPPLSYPPTWTDGVFRRGSLGTGNVRLRFVDCVMFYYEARFWNDKLTLDEADPIAVVEGEDVSGLTVVLPLREGVVMPPSTTTTTRPEELPYTGFTTPLAAMVIVAFVSIGIGSILISRSRADGRVNERPTRAPRGGERA
jgi:hypothetical protein